MNCGLYKTCIKWIYSGCDIHKGLCLLLSQFLLFSSLCASVKISTQDLLHFTTPNKKNLRLTPPDSTLTIPVVVHIIHNNGENIADN